MPDERLSMSVLAAILDPSDNGFDIGDLSLLVGVIVAISALTAAIVRWNARRVAKVRTQERTEMESRIKAAVEHVAAKVQPKNGGHGWDDVHHKLDTVITRQGEVISDLSHMRTRLDEHIDWHLDKGE
jgi:hypothetical protein